MNNPFNKGDKVTTKIKGQIVEATVTQTFNQEVQVRTPDNKLLWRVVKTVTLVEAALGTAPAEAPENPAEPEAEPTVDVPAADSSAEPSTESTLPAEQEAEEEPSAEPEPDNGTPGVSTPYKRTRGRRHRRHKI